MVFHCVNSILSSVLSSIPDFWLQNPDSKLSSTAGVKILCYFFHPTHSLNLSIARPGEDSKLTMVKGGLIHSINTANSGSVIKVSSKLVHNFVISVFK